MANNTTKSQFTQAVKAGDWVLPITVEGQTVYALQINKSKEEKENIDNILAEYANAGIEVFTYKGKNDLDVLLVKADEKLRSKRVGVKEQKMVAVLMQAGMTEEQARQAWNAAK